MANDRVNEIDLLRFVAALAVVFFHYAFRGYAAGDMSVMPYPLLAPVAKYGYLGVDLFFMISGFVILRSAASGSLKRFVVSRLVRLYPAFWACCSITFAVTMAIGQSRYSASFGQYLVNMTMLSGFVHVPPIDGVYWSLFVELKFYALVAVVLFLRRIDHSQLLLILWLIATAALEVVPIRPLRSLLFVEYAPYFIAGAIYYLVWLHGMSLTRAVAILGAWGLAVYQIVEDLPWIEKEVCTAMSLGVIVGIVTCFFLVMLLVALRRSGLVGRKNWLMVGALTYPLYLLHQNIGFMVFNLAYPTINAHVLLWGTVILMLVAAYAVNRLVERTCSSPMKRALDHLCTVLQGLTTRSSGETLAAELKR